MSFIKKHYHWLIAALVLIHLTIHGGVNNNVALFFLPVSEDFGVSRSAFSLSTSLKAVSSVLGTFLSGAVLLRFGYRKSVFAFLLVAVAGMSVLSASNNMVIYSIGCVLWGLADGVCISSGPPRLINSWFHRHQCCAGCSDCSYRIGRKSDVSCSIRHYWKVRLEKCFPDWRYPYGYRRSGTADPGP